MEITKVCKINKYIKTLIFFLKFIVREKFKNQIAFLELEEPILKKKIKLTNGNDDKKCQNINVYSSGKFFDKYFKLF